MLTQAANLPETKPEAKDLELNGVPLRFEIVQFLKPQHQHIIRPMHLVKARIAVLGCFMIGCGDKCH